MRILIVSQYFWPEDFRINEVAKSLVESGFEIDVLTGKPNYPAGKFFEGYRFGGCLHEKYFGIDISRVPLIPRGKDSKILLALNYLSFIVFGLILGPWIKRNAKYDVIFVYGISPLLQAIPALFLAKLKRVPLVLWVQDLWPQSLSATGYIRNRFILWCVEKVVRFIYRNADLLLVQSPAFIEPVRLLAGDTPIKYYPNSVDDSFSRVPDRNVPEVPGLSEIFSVVFAGNIGVAQAPEVILEAATLLKDNKDINFIVLGDGSRREWMVEQVNQRGLNNLHLPGRFPVEDMPGFMQKASVLLVTLADREIFAATVPNKVQAYMAAGRPIIACMNGQGALLVLEAEAGCAVPAENHVLLAEAVLRTFRMSAAERDRLGVNARSYYRKHFDHKTLIVKLIEHFEDLRIGS